MKKLISLILSIVLLLPCLPVVAEGDTPDWAEDGVLRIFGIGNSYTEDTFYKVPEIAKYLGVEKVEIAFLYIGGCTVKQHLDNWDNNRSNYTLFKNFDGAWTTEKNAGIKTGLAMKDWDFVVLSESAVKAGTTRTIGDVERWASIVRKQVPDATLVWNVTWAYPNEYGSSEFASLYGRDHETMYNGVIATTQEKVVPVDTIDMLIPNATAIQNARETYLGDVHTNLFRDKLHLTYNGGRYIVAMNALVTMLGVDINPMLDYFDDKQFAAIAVESVLHAQENPWAVTESAYPSTLDRAAMKNRYQIQTRDFNGDDGGWMINDRDEYNWLENKSYAAKKGIELASDNQQGNVLTLTLPEKGKTELLYLMTQPVGLPDTVVIGSMMMSVEVPEGFGGKVSVTVASGQNFSLQNAVTWTVDSSVLTAGWNDLSIPFDEGTESGYFDYKTFKVAQFIIEGAPGAQVSLGNIYMDGN